MSKQPKTRLFVHPNFKRYLKTTAARENTTMIDLSNLIASKLENNNIDEKPKKRKNYFT